MAFKIDCIERKIFHEMIQEELILEGNIRYCIHVVNSSLVCRYALREDFNTLRTGSFKLFKRPLPGFLTILTL